MEILDAYCGLGPWRSRDPILPYQPSEILQLMDHFGISRSVVYANTAMRGWYEDVNDLLLELIGEEPRFVPAFVLAPDAVEPARIERQFGLMKEVGAAAVWLRPESSGQGHGVWPWLLKGILQRCAACRVPVFLNTAQTTPDDVHRLCETFPDLRLILCEVSYHSNGWLFPLVAAHSGLHVCLGQYYIPASGPVDFVKRFSADRLVFGSNLPHFSPGGLIGYVMYADLADEEKEKILGGNMRRLMAEVSL